MALCLSFAACARPASGADATLQSVSGELSLPETSSGSASESAPASASDGGGQSASASSPSYAVAFSREGDASGFWLTVGEGGDIPTAGLDNGQLQDKLDAAVDFAAARQLSTIYLQVKTGAKTLTQSAVFDPAVTGFGFDIAEYLCTAAAAKKIQVYAVLDLLSADGSGLSAGNPASQYAATLLSGEGKYFDPANAETNALLVKAVGEIAAYPVAGVILSGLDLYGVASPGNYTAAALELIRACRSAAGDRRFGISFDGVSPRVITADAVKALGSGVDCVCPTLYNGVDSTYSSDLNRWCNAVSGAKVYPVDAAYKVSSGKFSAREMSYQVFIGSIKNAVGGAIFSSYASLAAGAADFSEVSGMLATAGSLTYTYIDTSISQTLQVTSPAKKSVSTTASAYYVMGTSDPSQTLTMNGAAVTRQGTRGCFALKVDLALGDNTLTFRNGGSSYTVTITRNSPSTAVSTISVVTAASRFPVANVGITSGDTLDIACVGPSGGSITVRVGGQSVQLSQVAAADRGVPATFRGSVTLSSSGAFTDLGVVTYTLSYGGNTSTYSSVGHVYAAASGASLALRVTDYYGTVVSDKDDTGSILGSFKTGSLVSFSGFATNADGIAFKLADGSYMSTKYCEFYTAAFDASYRLTGASVSRDGRDEIVTFKTGNPGYRAAVTVAQSGSTLTLRFYGAASASLPAVSGTMAASASVSSFTGGQEVKIALKSGVTLWGYNVEYDAQNNVLLRLRSAPHRSDVYGRPLTGIRVVLDPGHSGDDTGALGMGGVDGPTEADINVALAYAVKYRLEQMGATVTLTHDGSSGRVRMDQRCATAEAAMPDVFVSLHHNSTTSVKDHSETNWMESFYFFSDNGSKALGDALLGQLGTVLGRTSKGSFQDYYYMTRIPFAPAVLLESGYMINVAQYEACCSAVVRYKAACAIADGILSIIPE